MRHVRVCKVRSCEEGTQCVYGAGHNDLCLYVCVCQQAASRKKKRKSGERRRSTRGKIAAHAFSHPSACYSFSFSIESFIVIYLLCPDVLAITHLILLILLPFGSCVQSFSLPVKKLTLTLGKSPKKKERKKNLLRTCFRTERRTRNQR